MLGNRYRILETLGSGGMAVVYKARDTMLERPVAVKLLRQNFSDDDNFRQQFRREAQAAANLSHPNITTIHDFGFDDGRLFIVLEFMPGKDLKSLIRSRGVFPVAEAVHLMLQACAAIGYAHRSGIIHCDIKPHNMLVAEDGRLKVTDFGIARVLATINPEEKTDEVWGSPQYFSPEQARGMAPSPASDVYSLGVVLYELVTGRLPFTHNEARQLAISHQEDVPPHPREINPLIPQELDEVIMKVLAKEPSQRYRSADQLGRVLAAFERHAGESFPAPVPVSQPLSAAGSLPAEIEKTPTARRTAQDGYAGTAALPPAPPAHDSAAAAAVDPAVIRQTHPPRRRIWDIFNFPLALLGFIVLILLSGLIPFWVYILVQFGFFS